MRISDWSSDVCSSDLATICFGAAAMKSPICRSRDKMAFGSTRTMRLAMRSPLRSIMAGSRYVFMEAMISRRRTIWKQPAAVSPTTTERLDRKRVVEGKNEEVRVDGGGRGSQKNKK